MNNLKNSEDDKNYLVAAVLRKRDVYPGSDFFPSLIQIFPPSRIHIKEFKYFNPKTCFVSSRKYDPGCSSRIQIPDSDPGS
jgi:hypothetical protein